jgi:hypothetical protein
MNLSAPVWSARRMPTVEPSTKPDARCHQHVQEVEQVEHVDEGVGDLHKDFGESLRGNGGHDCLPT